jgi:hypothetical protein
MVRGWFFESMRHSLSAKGVKTSQQPTQQKPFIGSRAKPLQRHEAKPVAEMMEQDPGKKWLWGANLKARDKVQIVRNAVSESKEQVQQDEIEPSEPSEAPKTLEAPDKSVRKSKAKYSSVDDAMEAAQNEMDDRYGGDNTGVIKNDDEQERKLVQNMGLR